MIKVTIVYIVLALLAIPIPVWLLDILLASMIGIALMVLIISLAKSKWLDFARYPGLLLVITLFRFSWNVTSTKFILMDGYAGQVIQTFGTFVTHENIIVGSAIFLIFVIIQFMVITKGSTRIAKIVARFMIDATPGKQMAIDADLKAERITKEEAKKRREDIWRKMGFCGAMEGASKFVKADAIVGLIIIGINIAGGFIIGSIEKYTVLAIGSGLANQIPTLLFSISSGIIVTKRIR